MDKDSLIEVLAIVVIGLACPFAIPILFGNDNKNKNNQSDKEMHNNNDIRET